MIAVGLRKWTTPWTRALKFSALTVIVCAGLYGSTLIDEGTVHQVTARAGMWGPVVISAFILFTQVCAPLSGSLGLFIGIKLYGYGNAMTLFYTVSMISATINFFLSRVCGRAVVRRLVGASGLNQIDDLSQAEERTILAMARLLGYYFFDFISYAAGFSQMPYRTYMAYTAALTLVPFGVQYFLFRNLDFNSPTGVFLYYGSVFATGIIFSQVFYKLFVKADRHREAEAVTGHRAERSA